jgi:probable HAF family extracellular repeat protein
MQKLRCCPTLAVVFSGVAGVVTSAQAASFTISPIDVTGAQFTNAVSINATGQVVGLFGNATGTHGFLYAGGVFSTIDVPGASSTVANGINDAGQVVGRFQDATGTHGFLKTGGVFSTFDVPGGEGHTDAEGINNGGQIVGAFSDATGQHGFLKTGGVFTTIDVPGHQGAFAHAINDVGQIVGSFQDATGQHGFVDTGGVFTIVDVPGSSLTLANGITDAGLIVGRYQEATGQHGFLDSGGLFSPIDVPGSNITSAGGVNDAGLIVGRYQDGTVTRGFLATPAPDPDLLYFTLAPCRVVDTRGLGAPVGGPALQGQETRILQVSGYCSIPSTAKALSLNVTVTQTGASGNLRLFPAGSSLPLASSINYAIGQTRANNAIMQLNLAGKLAVFVGQPSNTTTHLIIDVSGYFE